LDRFLDNVYIYRDKLRSHKTPAFTQTHSANSMNSLTCVFCLTGSNHELQNLH